MHTYVHHTHTHTFSIYLLRTSCRLPKSPRGSGTGAAELPYMWTYLKVPTPRWVIARSPCAYIPKKDILTFVGEERILLCTQMIDPTNFSFGSCMFILIIWRRSHHPLLPFVFVFEFLSIIPFSCFTFFFGHYICDINSWYPIQFRPQPGLRLRLRTLTPTSTAISIGNPSAFRFERILARCLPEYLLVSSELTLEEPIQWVMIEGHPH